MRLLFLLWYRQSDLSLRRLHCLPSQDDVEIRHAMTNTYTLTVSSFDAKANLSNPVAVSRLSTALRPGKVSSACAGLILNESTLARLQVTLVWTDPVATLLGTVGTLVHDLDLSVTNQRTGRVYLGNGGKLRDSKNNVEKVSRRVRD
jgi:hypothetical protein